MTDVDCRFSIRLVETSMASLNHLLYYYLISQCFFFSHPFYFTPRRPIVTLSSSHHASHVFQTSSVSLATNSFFFPSTPSNLPIMNFVSGDSRFHRNDYSSRIRHKRTARKDCQGQGYNIEVWSEHDQQGEIEVERGSKIAKAER